MRKQRAGRFYGPLCETSRGVLLPPYTCCGTPSPSSSWSQECGISSSEGSSEGTLRSLGTARPPSSPARSDSFRPAPLQHRGGRLRLISPPPALWTSGWGACEVTSQLLLFTLLNQQIHVDSRLPSSRSEKTSAVVSSLRFLLNSIESSLISLDALLISFGDERFNGGCGQCDTVRV